MRMAMILSFLGLMASCLEAVAQEKSAEACKVSAVRESFTLPPYPELSKMTGEQGTSVLLITLNEDGAPAEIEIGTSSGSLRLDEAARDYVKANYKWSVLPKGCVNAKTKLRVVWNLKSAPPPAGMNVVAMPKADYPKASLERREQGEVYMMIMMMGDQAPRILVVGSSGFPALDDKAVELVAQRSGVWLPARLNGKPVASMVPFVAVWSLD